MGPSHIIEDIMDRFTYLYMLKMVMLPFIGEYLLLIWVFQQNNDPKHKAKLLNDCFIMEKIELINVQPNLNPIKNPSRNCIETITPKMISHRNINIMLE